MRVQKPNEIVNQIKEYVENKNENYAILLEGEWGYGKTKFVENVVIPELEKDKKKVAYVSLYGKKDKTELDKEIGKEIFNQETKKIGKKDAKLNISSFLETATNIADAVNKINEKFPSIDFEKIVYGLASEKKLKEYVFFFDDLERRNMDINEVLAYINDFVEHKNCKSIIIANEKEIMKNRISSNIEMKYLVASSQNLAFKEPLKDNTLENLKERTNQIFEQDIQYNRIKEKLVGYTIHYKPDLEEMYLEFLEELELKKQTEEYLKENRKIVIHIFEEKNYYNLRTLKYLMNKMNQILPVFEKIQVTKHDKAILESTKQILLQACTYATILYKKGQEQSIAKEEFAKDAHYFSEQQEENPFSIRFVDELVQGYYVEEDDIKNVIQNHIKEESLLSKDSNDPVNQLRWIWNFEDEQIEDMLQRLREKIELDGYDVALYPRIAIYYIRLKKLGFSKNLEEILDAMKANVRGKTIEAKWEFNFETDLKKEETGAYRKIIREIRREANTTMSTLAKEFEEIFADPEKIENTFFTYCEENKEKIFNNRQFLNLIDLNQFHQVIRIADSKGLSAIRGTVRAVYQIGNCERYFADIPNLRKMIAQLGELQREENFSKMKQFNLKLLQEELDNWLRIIDKHEILEKDNRNPEN